ncbi:cytochrome b6-f complex subunit PetL [Leptolyngbya sp. AN02str]
MGPILYLFILVAAAGGAFGMYFVLRSVKLI